MARLILNILVAVVVIGILGAIGAGIYKPQPDRARDR